MIESQLPEGSQSHFNAKLVAKAVAEGIEGHNYPKALSPISTMGEREWIEAQVQKSQLPEGSQSHFNYRPCGVFVG